MSEMFAEAKKTKASCNCPYCGLGLNPKDDYIAIRTEYRLLWMCVLCANSMISCLEIAMDKLGVPRKKEGVRGE